MIKPVKDAGNASKDMKSFPTSVKAELLAILNDYGASTVGPPKVKRVPGTRFKLYEARVRHPVDQTIYRLFFTPGKDAIYALSAFQKKSQTTPRQEIDRAEKRLVRAGLT